MGAKSWRRSCMSAWRLCSGRCTAAATSLTSHPSGTAAFILFASFTTISATIFFALLVPFSFFFDDLSIFSTQLGVLDEELASELEELLFFLFIIIFELSYYPRVN